ncbi:sugar transferase [Bacillus sp. SB49]|uniref:sugar transferase n=1 Tax=Bacillus sp. SB49 TaxID=1071080 RepID=UPI00047DC453|nr:sugar transferase [Bacillus sp. SB49]QHT48027.1 sugar transferase [Bacillus sp. SB49]
MYIKLKRFIDVMLSVTALLLLSPFILIFVIILKLDSKGPVLFKQKRVGINQKYFYMLKFRTMKVDTPKDTPTHLLINAENYITNVGKFMRKTSLDELPQIWNILLGHMSFVGPRPALWNQEDLIIAREKYGANDALPGLTGWAQVNGRDEVPIDLKAKLDGEYVGNISMSMDLKCIFLTLIKVIKRENIVEGPSK